jgi:hypothetical protein
MQRLVNKSWSQELVTRTNFANRDKMVDGEDDMTAPRHREICYIWFKGQMGQKSVLVAQYARRDGGQNTL